MIGLTLLALVGLLITVLLEIVFLKFSAERAYKIKASYEQAFWQWAWLLLIRIFVWVVIWGFLLTIALITGLVVP